MSNPSYEKLRKARESNLAKRFQSQQAQYPATVTSLSIEQGTGAVTAINATLDEGGAIVQVPVPAGAGVRAGNKVTLLGDQFDATKPLQFGQIDYSDDPTAGYADDGSLEPPEWNTPDGVSLLLGPNRASLTIYWLGIQGKGVTGYQPSMRRYPGGVEGEWGEPVGVISHKDGGIHLANLGADFAPGETVDVQIRALYATKSSALTGAFSVPGELRTFVLAVDDVSPGDASGLSGNVVARGILQLTPASSNLNAHFHHWQYEIATSSLGAGLTYHSDADDLTIGLAAGTYYAAVTPISGSGTPGGRFPGTGFAGPFVVADSAAPPDLVPPPDWTAPTLAIVRFQESAFLTVTLPTSPAYAYPADYDYTLARIVTNGSEYQTLRIANGQPSGGTPVPFGTSVVTLTGYDKNQNPSAASPSASITLGNAGAPTVAPTLTTAAFALGAQITWTAVFGAIAYEVWRAPDVAGAAGTFALVQTTDSLAWLDTLAGSTEVQPTRWYRVRAVNLQGNGPYSTNQQRQFNKLDGANIRANSITASQIAADVGIFNQIISNNDFLLNGVMRTSMVNTDTHMQIRGPVTTDPNMIRGYENMTSYVRRAWQMSGAGLVFYQVSSNLTSPPVRLQFDGNGMTAWNDAGTQYMLAGKLGSGVGISLPFVDIAESSMFFRMYSSTEQIIFRTNSVAPQNRFVVERVSNTEMRLRADWNSVGTPAHRFSLNDIELAFGTGTSAPDVSIKRTAGGVYGLRIETNDVNFKAQDIFAVRPATPTRGVIYLGDQTLGGRYVYFNGTNYEMPGANLVLNGVTVSSSAEVKRSIRAAKLDTKKAGNLKARRFRRRDDPTDREYLGFVAEEVREALPEAVVDVDPTTATDGEPQGSALGIDLMALCAAQQEMIGDLLVRVSRLEAQQGEA